MSKKPKSKRPVENRDRQVLPPKLAIFRTFFNKKSNQIPLFLGIALVLITFAVYARVADYEFIWNYDDALYVADNPQIRDGLTWETFRWVWSAEVAANWHPLTMLSHALDVTLFGMNAGAHHMVNVLLHVANTVLLFVLLLQLTQAPWRSAFVAALFALHPLHVQSVAWIAERKDVLSTAFWFLTLWAYVRYTKKPGWRSYVITLTFFALGLMAKPMLVTLPFTLLLLDVWPLQRLSPDFYRAAHIKEWSKKIIEKIPFFALSVIASVVTLAVQKSGGSRVMGELLTPYQSIGNALVSYFRYLFLTAWPIRLAVFYPHPLDALPVWAVVSAAIGLVVVTLYVLLAARRKPYLFTGWFWYLGTLLPVIGIVQVGSQAMADRYTYIPLTGIFVILTWGVADLVSRYRWKRVFLGISATGILLFMTGVTWFQLQFWRNDETLFRRALAVTTDNYVAHTNLGGVLLEQGKIDEAKEHFQEVIRLSPYNYLGYHGMGDVFAAERKWDDALAMYAKTIELNDDHVVAKYKYATILTDLGRFDEALEVLRKGLEKHPENPMLHFEMSRVLDKMGKTQEAAAHHALALKYGGPEVTEGLSKGRKGQINLARALTAEGKLEEAAAIYQRILREDTRSAEAHNNLANIRARQGRYEEALRHFDEALKLQPDNPSIYYNVAHVYLRRNEREQAIEYLKKTLELDPNMTRAKETLRTLQSDS